MKEAMHTHDVRVHAHYEMRLFEGDESAGEKIPGEVAVRDIVSSRGWTTDHREAKKEPRGPTVKARVVLKLNVP